MDPLKEAFQRIKEDIISLKEDLYSVKKDIEGLKEMLKIANVLPAFNSTTQHINSTIPTQNPAHKSPFSPLKGENQHISTGNEGVPTDRQTDQQTDRQTPHSSISDATEILNSLDNVKKEIRLKFKRLTDQEVLVFSTIYQLEEESGPIDYKSISQKLLLTESSIRDYVGRLIKKGIPLEKKKINNKTIQLSISQNLKKIASLSTILYLRDS